MTDTDQTTPLERAEERARDLREQAAATAVALLGGLPRPEGADPIDLTDVIDLANWLLSGTHPLERVDSSPAPMWATATLRSSMADRLWVGPLGARPAPGVTILDDPLPEPVDAAIVCGASSPQYELTCGLPDGHRPFRLAEPGHLPKTWDHATGEHGGTAWEGTTAVTFSGGITYLQPEDDGPPLFPHPDDQGDPPRGYVPEQHWPVVLVNDPDQDDGQGSLVMSLALFRRRLYAAPVGTLPEFGPAWLRANPLAPLAYAHREAFREADAADRRMPF